MFLQLVDILDRLASLFATGSSIAKARNRRRIGQRLVKIQQSIAAIALNAQDIERELEFVLEWYRLPTCETPNFAPSFARRFDFQKHELLKLNALLKDTQPLIEIYGPDCAKELASIIGKKISFIEFLSHIFFELPVMFTAFPELRPNFEYHIILPRTFDLNAYQVLCDSRKISSSWNLPEGEYYDQYSQFGDPAQILAYFCVAIQIKKDGKEEELVTHCSKLLKEMIDMNTSKRLQNIADGLAKTIRENFKIEEIF